VELKTTFNITESESNLQPKTCRLACTSGKLSSHHSRPYPSPLSPHPPSLQLLTILHGISNTKMTHQASTPCSKSQPRSRLHRVLAPPLSLWLYTPPTGSQTQSSPSSANYHAATCLVACGDTPPIYHAGEPRLGPAQCSHPSIQNFTYRVSRPRFRLEPKTRFRTFPSNSVNASSSTSFILGVIPQGSKPVSSSRIGTGDPMHYLSLTIEVRRAVYTMPRFSNSRLPSTITGPCSTSKRKQAAATPSWAPRPLHAPSADPVAFAAKPPSCVFSRPTVLFTASHCCYVVFNDILFNLLPHPSNIVCDMKNTFGGTSGKCLV
jgi:hypothetical protein